MDPYLCTRIRLQPCSNTFVYGCLFVYPPVRTKMKATPELDKILQTHAVFLCGFLHLSRYRADLPSGMSIMQRFKLLGSSARFVRDAPLRPSSTQGVELFFPLFSKCGVCQLSSTLRFALNPMYIPGSDCKLRCTLYVSICPEPDVHSWIRSRTLFWRLPYKCVILLLCLCLAKRHDSRRLLTASFPLLPFVS